MIRKQNVNSLILAFSLKGITYRPGGTKSRFRECERECEQSHNTMAEVYNKNENQSIVHKTLNFDSSVEKAKSNFFYILRWTGFLMIPLTTLCDEYSDRPKLSEQKTHLSI